MEGGARTSKGQLNITGSLSKKQSRPKDKQVETDFN